MLHNSHLIWKTRISLPNLFVPNRNTIKKDLHLHTMTTALLTVAKLPPPPYFKGLQRTFSLLEGNKFKNISCLTVASQLPLQGYFNLFLWSLKEIHLLTSFLQMTTKMIAFFLIRHWRSYLSPLILQLLMTERNLWVIFLKTPINFQMLFFLTLVCLAKTALNV